MDTTKLTREEALRRWNASKENKRKMVEKLENLVRKSCLERTGKEPIGVEVWYAAPQKVDTERWKTDGK